MHNWDQLGSFHEMADIHYNLQEGTPTKYEIRWNEENHDTIKQREGYMKEGTRLQVLGQTFRAIH